MTLPISVKWHYPQVSSDLWTQIFASRTVDFPVEPPRQSAAKDAKCHIVCDSYVTFRWHLAFEKTAYICWFITIYIIYIIIRNTEFYCHNVTRGVPRILGEDLCDISDTWFKNCYFFAFFFLTAFFFSLWSGFMWMKVHKSACVLECALALPIPTQYSETESVLFRKRLGSIPKWCWQYSVFDKPTVKGFCGSY